MAPRWKLLDNFHVTTFGSNRNMNDTGKYLMPPMHVNTDLLVPMPGIVRAERLEEISYVSETRLSNSLSQPMPRDQAASKPTIGSDKRPDPDYEVTSGGGKATKKKKTVDVQVSATLMRKKRKTAPNIVTRCWQEVWSYKFTWAKYEFDARGDLIGIVCQSCTEINGQKKILVPKGDNLEKHEGKKTYQDDGIPLPDLKKGNTYMNVDCKYNKFSKLWVGHKQVGIVVDLLVCGLQGEEK